MNDNLTNLLQNSYKKEIMEVVEAKIKISEEADF